MIFCHRLYVKRYIWNYTDGKYNTNKFPILLSAILDPPSWISQTVLICKKASKNKTICMLKLSLL